MDILFGGTLPTDEDIGDPPGVELVPNPPNFPSLPGVGEGVPEPVTRPTFLPANSGVSLRGPSLSGTEHFIHRLQLHTAMDVKSHIEKRISKCPLEHLALLEEDLLKLVSVIDNLNIDSSSLRVKIAELTAASTEYAPLRATSLKMLSPDTRAQQLAVIDSSIAHVRSSQQAASEDYQAAETSLASVQARLEALMQERERLGTEASQFEGFLLQHGATISQHQKEMSLLEQEKCTVMESPILSLADVETLKTLERLLEDRRRSFRDIVLK